MERIEINISTGALQRVQLTPEEVADAEARAAAEAAVAPLRAIVEIEQRNPITHRANREFKLADLAVLRQLRDKINALDAEVAQLASRPAAPLPAIPESHLERVLTQVEQAIRAERAKL